MILATMFNDERWHPTNSAKLGPEHFYPKRHVGWREWDVSPYRCIPDHRILGVQQSDRASFRPSKLCHATDRYGAESIVIDRAFWSQTAKTIGEASKERFSWWSFAIDEGEQDREKTRYQELNPNPQNQEILLEFFNSPAFQHQSRYGNFKFTYNIQTLVKAYRDSVCPGHEPEFRVLGTFQYRQEIMHAVVVLPPGVPLFQDCPPVPNDPNAVVSVSKKGWMWRPDSTGDHPTYRRWDHVSFAFYLPSKGGQFTLPPGDPPLTYCELGIPNLSGSYHVSKEEFSELCNTWGVSK